MDRHLGGRSPATNELSERLVDVARRAVGGDVESAMASVRTDAGPATRRARSKLATSANSRRRTSDPKRSLQLFGAALRPRSGRGRAWRSRRPDWSASSRYCVVSRIVTPSSTSWRTVSQSCSRLRGSSPVVGSSKKSRRGRSIMPMARSRRRRMPPEYVPARRCRASVRSKAASSSVGPGPGRPAGKVAQLRHHLEVLLPRQQIVDRRRTGR